MPERRPGRSGRSLPTRAPRGAGGALALLGAGALAACAGEPLGAWPELESGLDARDPLPCAVPDEPPEKLSDHPCFAGHPDAPVMGFVPYAVQAPFWSDGLAKDRFLGVPDGALLVAAPDGAIELPPGSLAIKVFRDGERRIETRLLTRVARAEGGEIQAATYVWSEDQTDAHRTDGGAVVPGTSGDWSVPSAEACFDCHSGAARDFLGLRIAQVNGELRYPGGRAANQIATWVNIGLLDPADLERPDRLERLASPGDAGAPLGARARAYLDANCAHCHRPGAEGGGAMDLRGSTALPFTATCGVAPELGDPWDGQGALIAPGRPDRSVLLSRVASADPLWRMPPLGSSRVDEEAAELLAAWIADLGDCDGGRRARRPAPAGDRPSGPGAGYSPPHAHEIPAMADGRTPRRRRLRQGGQLGRHRSGERGTAPGAAVTR